MVVSVQADADNGIDRLSLAGMIFANTNEAISFAIHDEVSVAITVARREDLRLAVQRLAIEMLVFEIRKVDHAVGHRERAAAVFVYGRARVKVGWGAFVNPTIRGTAHNDITTGLGWPAFDPVNVLTIHRDLDQGNCLGGDQVSRDGRFPTSIGCSFAHRFPPFSLVGHRIVISREALCYPFLLIRRPGNFRRTGEAVFLLYDDAPVRRLIASRLVQIG